jgi:predicted esterase
VTEGPEYSEHRLKVARTARWGLIGTLGESTRGVWIVLHGYGQLAAELAASAHWPAQRNTAFVFPEALQRFYVAEPFASHATAPVGASWMTKDARLDDIADNHAYLDDLAAEISQRAPGVVFGVLGFSQGAATAARWAEARAKAGQPLSALVIWGALCPPEVDISPTSPLSATTLRYVCGIRDRWVTPERLQSEWNRLQGAGRSFQVNQFDGGHRLDDLTLEAALTSL